MAWKTEVEGKRETWKTCRGKFMTHGKDSSLMTNRIKVKSYFNCTGLVKWGEQLLIIILQKLLRLKHSAKQIQGNETFITE